MDKPHSQSVTSTQCDCGYLERSANDAHNPIAFDATVNEYHYHYKFHGRDAQLMIYHCPWCGGVASKSHRASLFHELKSESCEDVSEKTATCLTLDDVIAVLGQPDEDGPTIIRHHEKDDSSPRVDRVRRITYHGLYEEMSVLFEQRIGETICRAFVPKQLKAAK
jgi:hypothetical protein